MWSDIDLLLNMDLKILILFLFICWSSDFNKGEQERRSGATRGSKEVGSFSQKSKSRYFKAWNNQHRSGSPPQIHVFTSLPSVLWKLHADTFNDSSTNINFISLLKGDVRNSNLLQTSFSLATTLFEEKSHFVMQQTL